MGAAGKQEFDKEDKQVLRGRLAGRTKLLNFAETG